MLQTAKTISNDITKLYPILLQQTQEIIYEKCWKWLKLKIAEDWQTICLNTFSETLCDNIEEEKKNMLFSFLFNPK